MQKAREQLMSDANGLQMVMANETSLFGKGWSTCPGTA